MSEPGNIEEILAEMTPRIVKVRVLLRQDLLTQHAELEDRWLAERAEDERENRTAVAPEIAKQLAALEDEIDAAKREFSFKSIGRAAWVTLVGKYPPTKEQLKHDRSLRFDPLRLPAAAVAATSHEPKLTIDQATQLEDAVPDQVFEALWGAACQANVGSNETPKSLAAGMIRHLSGASGTTAALEGSLDQSS